MSSFPKFLAARIEFPGPACELHVSVPCDVGSKTFWSPMSIGAAFIGWIRFEFVSVMHGEAVFAATELRLAHASAPSPQETWPLFSSLRTKGSTDAS